MRAARERTSEIRHTMRLLMHLSILAFCVVLCITLWVQSITESSYFYPYGLDDGDVELPRNDDGGSPKIPLPIQFVLFGTCMNALWVSINQLLFHNWQSNNL